MKYIDYKKNHKYKGILRLALILVLILILGILFFEVWTNYYNLIMRRPYIMKGNYFLAIVYMIIYYLSLIMLDGLRIDNMKISNIVFTEFLSIIITNVVSFVIIILPAAATALIPFEPMLILTGIDFIVVVVWGIISKTIMSRVYPATPMLLISNADKLDIQKIKFNERKDIYNIVETISSDRPFNEIKDKIGKFRNVIIGDITAEVRNDIVKYCYENDVNTYVLPKISDIIIKWSRDIYSFDAPLFLSENDGITFENEIIKRVFDIIISVILLVVFAPLLIILALLIKLEDGGPIFYVQERVTKDEKKFIHDDQSFFEIWTNKESLLKCMGLGMKSSMDKVPSLPFNNIKFFDKEYYYSKTIIYKNSVITVTRSSTEPFEIEIKEETIDE